MEVSALSQQTKVWTWSRPCWKQVCPFRVHVCLSCVCARHFHYYYHRCCHCYLIVRLSARLSVCSFVCTFIPPFVRSFVRSFVRFVSVCPFARQSICFAELFFVCVLLLLLSLLLSYIVIPARESNTRDLYFLDCIFWVGSPQRRQKMAPLLMKDSTCRQICGTASGSIAQTLKIAQV